MKQPNFFIVGAPRCGTSSLYTYLQGHPKTCLTSPKEPHYFASDLHETPGFYTSGRDEYFHLFEACPEDAVAIGEASTGYLYSRIAIKNIAAAFPSARLIVMLRNPIDLAYSLHAQQVNVLNEDVQDFEAAWKLQAMRARGGRIPASCKVSAYLQYGKVAMLGHQVERLLKFFPKENALFIFFEDFVADTKGIYEQTLAFLGLESDERVEFAPENSASQPRSAWLSELTRVPPPPIRHLVATAKRLTGVRDFRLWRVWRRLIDRPSPRSALRPEFRQELLTFFDEDIDRLARVSGRDLSLWKVL